MVRAPPRVLPRSLAPSGRLGGGRSGPGSPLLGFELWGWRKGVHGGAAFYPCEGHSGVRHSPSPDCPPTGRAVWVRYPRAVGAGVRVCGPFSVPLVCTPCGGCAPRGGSVAFVCRGAGWGGGACAMPSVCAAGGGLQGGGSLCLVPSFCLPWAGNKAGVTGVVLSMGGVAPHNTAVRARPPSLGAICAASWRVGAGSLVLHGPCGSLQLGRGGAGRALPPLSGGGGETIPPASGLGAGAPGACGPVGGVGGGGRAAASLLPLWAAARGTPSWPPSCRRRTPVRRARAVGVAEPPRARGGWGAARGPLPWGPPHT